MSAKLKTASWLVILLLSPFLLFFALMLWPDASLTPAAKAWLTSNPTKRDAAENSFFTILGINAPAEQSPHEVGMQRAAAMNQAVDIYLKTNEFHYQPEEANTLASVAPEALDKFCRFEDTPDCLQQLRAQRDEITALAAQHMTLLARYRSLHNIAHYQNVLTPSIVTPLPEFSALLNLHRLFLLDIVNTETAAAEIARDIHYVRRMMADANTLLAKMVAASLLNASLHGYAQMLETGLNVPTALLKSLTDVERSLEQPLKVEFQMAEATYTGLSPIIAQELGLPVPNWLLPFKPNMSLNSIHTYYQKTLDTSRLPATELAQQAPDTLMPQPGWWDYARNPVGTILNEIAAPALYRYALNLYATEAILRLVRLKTLIRDQQVTDEAIPDFLESRKTTLGNPFTGNVMDWNPETRQLFFKPPDKDKVFVTLPAKDGHD